MSKSKTETKPDEPIATLDSISTGMKRQKKQLLSLAALCVISVSSALLALGLLITRSEPEPPVEVLSNEELLDLREQLADLDTRYVGLLEQSKQNQGHLETLSQQVAAMDINDERNAVFRVQKLLARQEQDFQNFLGTLEGGLYNFHMMIPHSRGWWDDYKADLLEVVALSQARERDVEALREIEPKGINQ